MGGAKDPVAWIGGSSRRQCAWPGSPTACSTTAWSPGRRRQASRPSDGHGPRGSSWSLLPRSATAIFRLGAQSPWPLTLRSLFFRHRRRLCTSSTPRAGSLQTVPRWPATFRPLPQGLWRLIFLANCARGVGNPLSRSPRHTYSSLGRRAPPMMFLFQQRRLWKIQATCAG